MTIINNLYSPNGNKVANQFEITTPTGRIFQSYQTVIAEYKNGKLILDNDALDYSRTTSKYLYIFTGHNRKELEQGIKDGSIKTANLNV